MRKGSLLIMLFFSSGLFPQQPGVEEKKQLKAYRITEPITIDGRLDEPAWKKAQSSSNWYTFSPSYGQPCPFNTEVAVLYDNDALYIGAWLNDPFPDSLMKEIAVRDYGVSKSEVFVVWLNPYNDGQNLLQFEVSIANVQKDGKVTNNVMDLNWDAIYQTATSTDDKGWYAEMRIPFKSLYFPQRTPQEWGINFLRWVPRKMSNYCWNYMDRTRADIGSQMGILTGLENLKQPLRLNLFPYLSGNIQRTPMGTSYAYSTGLDLQYGINESFTLDMTLVPDFGQRKSDYEILNLTPFEVRYNENRQFFLSGFELFKKSELFYSRRIGKKPSLFGSIPDSAKKVNGKVISNPMESQLINAFKITGRTNDGLGLGFFNAITANTYAVIADSSGRQKKILSEYGKNYNMMVYDKIFGKYSYLNLINLNTCEPGTHKMANVTGSAFKFADANNKYMVYGKTSMSLQQQAESTPVTGYATNITAGKGSGPMVWLYNGGFYTDKYNPNDMGFLTRNNILWQKFTHRYTNFNPKKYFITWNYTINAIYRTLFRTLDYYRTEFSASFEGTLHNYSIVQIECSGEPVRRKDYFEPRTAGRYSYLPPYAGAVVSYTSDTRRNMYGYLSLGRWQGEGRYNYIGCGSVMNLSDRLTLQPSFSVEEAVHERGFADKINNDSIIYGFRNVTTTTLMINGKYAFDNKNILSVNIRQYRSYVDYKKYCLLRQDGNLADAPFYTGNKDINFNIINIDVLYSWNFSAGSFLTIGWKNGIYADETVENDNFYSYFRNLNYVLGRPQNNMFSVKLTYYFDYAYINRFIRKT